MLINRYVAQISYAGSITINTEISARVLISRNFADAEFRENKTLAKRRNHPVVYCHVVSKSCPSREF